MSSDLAVGVIGLGFGANHARVLNELEGVRLAAVCDADPKRLASVARGRTARAYADYGAMLAEEHLDALIVAVPTRLHETVTRAAIEAGVAVLVEKPIAPTLSEGQRLARASEEAGVPLMSGHIERFNPAVQELGRRIESGEAGRVLQLSARRLGPFAARTRDIGVVHDLAFHDIDIMRYLLEVEAAQVFAQTQANVRTEFDDSLAGVLRFDNGAIGLLEVNWLTPRKVRELTVLCENGLFVLDYLGQTLEFHHSETGETSGGRAWSTLSLLGHEAGPVVRIPLEQREPLEHELSAFTAAVRNRTPMPVTSADALATLAIADALAESARTGLPVKPAR